MSLSYWLQKNKFIFDKLNSYGSFSSISKQIIKPNDIFKFEFNEDLLNCEIINNSIINIISCGLYTIHLNAICDASAEIAVCINNKPNDLMLCSTDSQYNTLNIFQTMHLNFGDKLSVINNGITPIETKKFILSNKNIMFTIKKIMGNNKYFNYEEE